MGERLARTLRATLAKGALAVYRTRFIDAERVPEGGAILAGNHVSYLDPVLLWCGAPRPTRFMAKSELWDVPVVGWALPKLLAFPVRRGSADRAAISTATDLLGEGHLVGIFPEGTRQRDGSDDSLGEANEGVAFIAMRAGVPVVPVGIAGTDRAMPPGARLPRFPRVTVVYGEPVHPEEFAEGSRKERLEALTAEIMRRIADARTRAREVRR